MEELKCKYCQKSFIPFHLNKDIQVTCGSKECKKCQQKDWRYGYHRRPERMKYRNEYMHKYRKCDKYKQYMKDFKASGRLGEAIDRYHDGKAYKLKLERYHKTDKFKNYRKMYASLESTKERIRKYLKNLYENDESFRRKVAIAVARRRAAENNIVESFTEEQWVLKVNDCKGVCPKCKKPFDDSTQHKLTIDHLYPVSLANKDFKATGIKKIYTIDDVQPLCKSCNSSKRDRLENKSKD